MKKITLPRVSFLDWLLFRMRTWNCTPVFVYYIWIEKSVKISQGNGILWINRGVFATYDSSAIMRFLEYEVKSRSDFHNSDDVSCSITSMSKI